MNVNQVVVVVLGDGLDLRFGWSGNSSKSENSKCRKSIFYNGSGQRWCHQLRGVQSLLQPLRQSLGWF